MSKLRNLKSITAWSLVTAMALAPSVSAGAGTGELKAWTEFAGNAVNDVMTYPSGRIRGSGSGTAIFQVTVDRDGDVVASQQLARPSSGLLNAAARKVVKNVDFPEVPVSLELDTLTFELHLSYGAGGMSLRESDLLRPGRVTSRQIATKAAPAVAMVRLAPNQAD